MKYATIEPSTDKAVLKERQVPADATKVLAVSVNPIDIVVAGGEFPLRSFNPGDTLGYGGVAEKADGTRVYFYDPEPPAGSLAEQIDLSTARTIDLPDGTDPKIAAYLGVPGMAAYAGTVQAGGVKEGETVLVTGAAGSVGMIAAQVAMSEGAKVVGLVRPDNAEDFGAVEKAGMTGLKNVEDDDELAEALKEAAPDGVDLVIDTLWGELPERFIPLLNHRARWVEIGSGAGAEARIAAPVFRNKLISILGHTNFLLTEEEARKAYEGVVKLAGEGKVTATFETVTFDQLPETWDALAAKELSGKYVVEF